MPSPGSPRRALDVETLAEGTFAVGGPDGFTVEARHVTHDHPSFGFRVTRRGRGGPGSSTPATAGAPPTSSR